MNAIERLRTALLSPDVVGIATHDIGNALLIEDKANKRCYYILEARELPTMETLVQEFCEAPDRIKFFRYRTGSYRILYHPLIDQLLRTKRLCQLHKDKTTITLQYIGNAV